MKKMVKLTALSIVLVASLSGCQTTTENGEPYLKCSFGGEFSDISAPQWVCGDANTDPVNYSVQAMGLSANQSGGIGHQRQLAILDAIRTLATQFSSKVVASIKNSTSTLGVDGNAGGIGATKDLTQALVDFELIGVTLIRTIEGPGGRFYAHVGMPKEVEAENIEKVVSTLQKKDLVKLSPEESKKLQEEIAKQFAE
jgi:hypothetical protein